MAMPVTAAAGAYETFSLIRGDGAVAVADAHAHRIVLARRAVHPERAHHVEGPPIGPALRSDDHPLGVGLDPLQSGGRFRTTIDDGVAAQKLADAAAQSHATGSIVHL